MNSRLNFRIGFPLLAAAMLASPGLPAAQSTVTALSGAQIVNVDNGTVMSEATLLIRDGRIVQLGKSVDVVIPADAKRLDMGGKFLVPGLINTHVHFGLRLPGAEGARLVNETDPELVLRMAANARRSLDAGITTVRLTGEYDGTDFALKKAIDRGEVAGPRIQTAGEMIVPTGGHGIAEADGPYGLAKLVREQIKRGATWIKIGISGGISDTHGDIAAAPMTDEELRVLVEVANRNGVQVTAHNGSPEAAKQALAAGVKGFEHGYFLTEENLIEMKKRDVWLVPTAVVSDEGAQPFYKRIGSPDWYLKRVEDVGRSHKAMLQKAIKLKVNIALGTDQMPFEPNSGTTATVHEAELYVKAGMSPLLALRAATIEPARMMRMDNEVGALRVGSYADVLALSANPLTDISALRQIGFVMKGGEVIRSDE